MKFLAVFVLVAAVVGGAQSDDQQYEQRDQDDQYAQPDEQESEEGNVSDDQQYEQRDQDDQYAQPDEQESEEGNDLISEMMRHMYKCMEEEKDIDISVCLTMFKNTSNLDENKFHPCKCMIACVQRKFEVLKPEGTFDWNKFTEHKKRIEEQKYLDEADKVENNCKGQTTASPDICETGFNMFKCSMIASKVGRDYVENLLKSFSGE